MRIPEDAEWRMYEKCPPEERLACLIYEYARESETVRKWIAAVRSDQKALAEQVAGHAAGTFWASSNQRRFLVECGDDFPDKAWLQTPDDKRNGLAERLCLGSEVARWTSRGTKPLPLLTRHGDPPLTLTPLKGIAPEVREAHSHAVMIDWTLSNARLLAQFELWLRIHEPPGRKIEGGKGRTSPADLLKALAAFRLTKKGCGRTASWAADFTLKKLGTPLYQDEATWSRTKGAATEFLRLTFGDIL